MNVKELLTGGKSMILAYDHGMEHGPLDFNIRSADPNNVLNVAFEGHWNGIVLHHGIAEKYYQGHFRDIPLIIKLNGKTNMNHLNPIAKKVCSVERAMRLGAAAVGYTVYDGSPQEADMLQEFGEVVEKAHDYGIPVIAWMTPRGPDIHNETKTSTLAYASRLGLEMGADFVVVKYNNDPQGFEWVTKTAGKCKVLLSGGQRIDDKIVLDTVYNAMRCGATGVMMGRNIWQHPKPFSMTRALHELIFRNKTPSEVMKYLES